MASRGYAVNDYSAAWPDFLRTAGSGDQMSVGTKPIIIDMLAKNAESELQALIGGQTIRRVVDNYDEQLAELFISQNAHLYRATLDIKKNSIAEMLESHYADRAAWTMGSWVYYPWDGQLVHVLKESLYKELRTIRNRDLITGAQQAAFADIKAACFGMSVGSSAAITLILEGGSDRIKIVDGAIISGSNLNRIRTGVANVGLEKSLVIARQLYEMNPYIQVSQQGEAITPDTIAGFLDAPWPTDVVIDEVDDLEVKIRLRVAARERRIPVLMATDLGDDVMLDVERYDLDADLPLFHGLVGSIEEILNKPEMTQREWLKYATAIIGTKNVPLDMQKSLLKVGSSLATQPQLGGTAMVAGAAIAYATRLLSTGAQLKSGRSVVSLEQAFSVGNGGMMHKRRHRRHSRILDNAMKNM